MQTESEQARRKTQNLDLYTIVSLVHFFFATLLGFPPGIKVKPTKKMETASKDPTGCKLGEEKKILGIKGLSIFVCFFSLVGFEVNE